MKQVPDNPTPAAAWENFHQRMTRLGHAIASDAYPNGPRDQAEGIRHLSRLMQYALQWFVEFGDPAFPAFHRFDDDWLKWGGPGGDFHYLRAKLGPGYAYRVTGNLRGARGFTFSLCEGEMQLNQMAVFGQWNHTHLTIGADGSLAFLLSETRPDGYEGDWFPLDPRTDHLNIRAVVPDWEQDGIPEFYVERLGSQGQAPAPPTPEWLATQLDKAATWVEATVTYWNRTIGRAFAKGPRNAIQQPGSVTGGVQDFSYGTGYWELGPDEGLLLEWERPRAKYWSVILYNLGWFESLELAHRITCLSDSQTFVDADDCVRAVVAHRDPGVPNWLDTEGRPTGMIATRWVWSENNPHPRARVVRLDELRAQLPASHPTTSPPERIAQIASRRRGIARRFRR